MATAVDQIMETLTELKAANPDAFLRIQEQLQVRVDDHTKLAMVVDEKPFDYDKAVQATLGSVDTSGMGVIVSAPVLTEDGIDALASQMADAIDNSDAAASVALVIFSVLLACA